MTILRFRLITCCQRNGSPMHPQHSLMLELTDLNCLGKCYLQFVFSFIAGYWQPQNTSLVLHSPSDGEKKFWYERLKTVVDIFTDVLEIDISIRKAHLKGLMGNFAANIACIVHFQLFLVDNGGWQHWRHLRHLKAMCSNFQECGWYRFERTLYQSHG